MEEFIARTVFQVDDEASSDEADAELGALLLRYLRHGYDARAGAWVQSGRDAHETLRRTCHAAEVLHRLDLDSNTAHMVREAGNWLINLPVRDSHGGGDRYDMHVYPSRFKTLAYLGRFDDHEVRRDFQSLLRKEVGGLVRNVGESDILTTCIVLDTLLHLERIGRRHEICTEEQYGSMIRALRTQLRTWRAPTGKASDRASTRRSEIDNARDLSYVLGLLQHADRENLPLRSVTAAVEFLTNVVRERSAGRGGDLVHALYAALQLAEHFAGDDGVRPALETLLEEVRGIYGNGEITRRWDLMSHTLVLRLLLTFYGEVHFTRAVAARFLRAAEQRQSAEQNLLEMELQAIVKERMTVELGAVKELTGGFSDDRVYRVPFSYFFPSPSGDHDRRDGLDRPGATSMIIKRSTRDAFLLATEHYNQLPTALRNLFVRLPSEAQVHKSGQSSSYYLVMEDLTNLYTFRHLFNEFDQRAMSEQARVLLERATAQACEAVFQMFRATRSPRTNFPGTQLARLYLSQIEAKLTRAVARVPWLKNPLDGFHVNEQRYKGLDYYLGIVTRHAHKLAPRGLGLAHGDYHSRNIMLDRDCTRLKLIDLDKLSYAGDYLADLATLVQDVSVYRRVSEPDRDFGLPREEIKFASNPNADAGTVENAVRYPALGRSASLFLQEHMLDAIGRFAAEVDDIDWKPRFWLATATAVLMRLAFQTEKEPAAVLYAEGARLLHELTRHLEQSHPLPPLLFPAEWPESPLARGAALEELPAWAARNELLRTLHDALRRSGLRPDYDRGAVRYYAPEAGDGPVAALTPAHRDALARLLLCCEQLDGALPRGVRLQPGAKEGDRMRTTLLLDEEAVAEEIVELTRSCVVGELHKGAATRRRG